MAVSFAALSTMPGAELSRAIQAADGVACAGDDRLSPALLDALYDPATVQVLLRNPGPGLRQFAILARLAPRVACDPPTTSRLLDAPVQIAWQQGVVVATPKHDAGSHPLILDICEWIRCLQAVPVAIDLGRMVHINSQMVAWLLRLAQHHAPARIVVRHAAPAVETQLRQLRLEHFLIMS